MVIPTHLIRNWDNEKRLVCRASKQLLAFMLKRPIIDLERENPLLFKYVNVLAQMKDLRKKIMLMKCYFLCCKVNYLKYILARYIRREGWLIIRNNVKRERCVCFKDFFLLKCFF